MRTQTLLRLSKLAEIRIQTFLDSSEETSKHESKEAKRTRPTSWKISVLFGTAAALCVLVTNIVIMIVVKLSIKDTENGVAMAFKGSCKKSKIIQLWSHLGINILSTVLLAASNNCSQLLCSPTRKDIEEAHSAGKWMNIGTQSIRNLSKIALWRALIWSTLVASSVPLHLFYNSVVFGATSANTYMAAVVTEEFIQNGVIRQDDPFRLYCAPVCYDVSRLEALQHSAELLEKLSVDDCVGIYKSDVYQSAWGDVLFVTPSNYTSPVRGLYVFRPGDLFQFPSWYPNSPGEKEAQYCLAQRTEEYCEVRIYLTLLWVVIACNALKVACFITTLLVPDFRPLATVGDAIASFMDNPEPLTSKRGPISAADVRVKHTESWHSLFAQRTLLPWRNERKRWATAVSWREWSLCIAGCLSILLATSVLLHFGLRGLFRAYFRINYVVSPTQRHKFDLIRQAGFGEPGFRLYLYPTDGLPLAALVLISNSPQFLVSVAYLLYNNLFTCMAHAYEISRFATVRKALRVTSPRGQQRSTFWLSLPFRYILPMTATMALLHWTMSRSIFLVQMTRYNDPHDKDGSEDTKMVGWSPLPIIVSICIGGFLILALFGFALRRLDAGISMVGSCSLAISAAANAAGNEKDAAFKKLMYGVVSQSPEEPHIRRVGFSSLEVEKLVNGEVYS